MIDETSHVSSPIVVVLTPRGRGAVATIEFQGECYIIDDAPSPLFHAANGTPLGEQPINQACFGHWGNGVREEVVVCRTDDYSVEIHCHGGDAAVQRIIDDLQSRGCAIHSWQQMKFAKADLFETECFEALARATTKRTAEILLHQQTNVLRSTFENLYNSHFSSNSDIRKQIERELDELLEWEKFGLHLTQPWNVVVAGRPNVGKSSLVNALLGYSRSVVFDKPGTTRDVVTAQTALDGWPIQFADTAGIRDAADQLESAGIELARRQLFDADCRVLLFDTSRPPEADDWRLLSDWPNAILVAHKQDLTNVWGEKTPESAIPVSSLTNIGLDDLATVLVNRLVPTVPDLDISIPFTARQIDLLKIAQSAVKGDNEPTYRTAFRDLLA